MKKVITILFIIFSTLTVFGQSNPIRFEGEILVTDQFGHYYEVSNNEIKKYSLDGELICVYSENVIGTIANVDVTNPYKVMVFFRDFGNIIILDNTLSPTSEEIDLSDINSSETSLACKSYNNGFWYFNFIQFQLVRLSKELNEINTSGNLTNLLNLNVRPNYIVEYNNRVYLNDPKNGILVFDIYGTYLKTIPILGLNTFQVKEKYIVYVNAKNQVETYDFFTLEQTIYLPEKYNEVQLVRIENEHIFVVNKSEELIIDKIEK
jgi:hypothetical protein